MAVDVFVVHTNFPVIDTSKYWSSISYRYIYIFSGDMIWYDMI